MKAAGKRKTVLTALFMLAVLLTPWGSVAAETLADVDAEIQSDPTPVRVSGQDAYNVYQGVTPARLIRKLNVLTASGVVNFASAGNLNNFYSFTGLAGVTDTKIEVKTTTSSLRLYRRGSSSVKETQSYLRSWWGDKYRGIEASRNEQAILAAWGSDLNRIYVIDVPAGVTVIGGLAAPMEKNGEYRAGGAYQYWYRGAQLGWLVYALYAPDYLESYGSAVTGAQKLGQLSLTDIGETLAQLRYHSDPDSQETVWMRFYGGYSRYPAGNGNEFGIHYDGLHGGYNKLVKGRAANERDRMNMGVFIGRGGVSQQDVVSGVTNDVTNVYAGIYSLYQWAPDQPRSWYGSASVLYGHLRFNNQVPGEMGYGLKQSYSGNIFAAALETGLTFRRSDDWIIEPQLQLTYTKILQNDFNDNLGARIHLQQGDSLMGGLGLRLSREFKNQAGRNGNVRLQVNYFHALRNRNELDVAGDPVTFAGGKNVYRINVGGLYPLGRLMNMEGNIGKIFGEERGWFGSLSLRGNW
ncbi:MAG TPA: autotransporter domain-containing protein [Patescibacteria group bacterium]|nr:autotransporter domain-containing protein [Patescibacteria group bacterium]